ncbi:MFS transporter [Gordonia spumicola]|uniref:MFS transporter n=1 Tax=Gordonia spumicola TaxID=589161 RepID=A0A7I9V5K9_9ACTN|nr:oligopeptide:H+ symporter [Gordonia spumicola]GEE00537.1 MFS transporter [Gordonia spumicola]
MNTQAAARVSRPPTNEHSRPHGLRDLSLTEMGERFSFYGMQSILAYYLIYSVKDGGLEVADTTAVGIVGAFGAFVFLTQIVGAWLADRLMAPRNLIAVGGVVIAVGYLTLALTHGMVPLIIGLVVIAFGTGALKTSVTSAIGHLYRDRPAEDRDAGFAYFYTAVVSGLVAGMLIVGFTQSRWGFQVGFLLAGAGMIASLVNYLRVMRSLPAETAVVNNPLTAREVRRSAIVALGFCAILAAVIASGLISVDNINLVAGIAIVVVFTAYIVRIVGADTTTPVERRRVLGYVPMWIAAAVTFGLTGQIFTSIPLFINDRVNTVIGGWTIPEVWISAIGPISLVLISAMMARTLRTSQFGKSPATTKYAIGIGIAAVAFLLLVLTDLWPEGRVVSPFFMAFCMIVSGLPEAFVGPIGLSLATRVAPARFYSQMVALQILSLGAGSVLAGQFGVLYTMFEPAQFFGLTAGFGFVAVAVLRMFSRRIEANLTASA